MRRDDRPQFPTWFVAAIWLVCAAAAHLMIFGGIDWASDRIGPGEWHTRASVPEPIEVTMVVEDPDDAEDSAVDLPDPSEPVKVKPYEPPVDPTAPPPPVAKVVPPTAPTEAPPPVKPVMKPRVEVKQSVEDKTQENPDADLMAEDANKVEEETRAEHTATDAELDKPEMGSTADDEDKLAQSEESPGNPERAPTGGALGRDKGNEETDRVQAELGDSQNDPRSAHETGTGASPDPDASPDKTQPLRAEQKALPEEPADPGAPETLTSPDGTWGGIQAQRDPKPEQKQRKKRLPPAQKGGAYGDMFGLGGQRPTANGVNLNLGFDNALDPAGKKQLADLKRADGERRLSQHRKSWEGLGLKRWRHAIENSGAQVKVGNQTALNTAKSPFRGYLWRMHNRIHPVFAMNFLPTLDRLGETHPMNQMERFARMEIVLNRKSGAIERLGIIRTSGVTAFDVGALESVYSAAPFGKPPVEIISHDGKVYLHWEFYRLPRRACSNQFAFPYLLQSPEKQKAPPATTPPGPRRIPPKKQQYGQAPDSPEEHHARGHNDGHDHDHHESAGERT